MEPIADSGNFDEAQVSAGEFLITRSDSAQFFDPLKEVFDGVATLVVAFVEFRWVDSVSLRWNACSKSEFSKLVSKCVTVIGLVSKNGSRADALNQSRCCNEIVRVSRRQRQAHSIAVRIHEGMNLGIRPTSRFPNALTFRGSRGSMRMFVYFAARGIDSPELPFAQRTESFKNVIPETGFAPLFPAGVDRCMWSENTQSPPTATFTEAEQYRLKDDFGRRLGAPFLLSGGARNRYRTTEINFFSSMILRASFSYIRIVAMLECSETALKYNRNLQFSNTP